MTALEFILYLAAFVLCALVMTIIFIKIVTDWIGEAENHKK